MKHFSYLIGLIFVVLISACKAKNSDEINYSSSDSFSQPEPAVDTLTNVAEVVADTIPSKQNSYIIVDKPKLKLYVVEAEDTIFSAPICAGRVKGDKIATDDRRTPEGDFKITNIHNSTEWLYHTDDGRWVPHVYGPWFLRLDANGWQGIGIHGTNAPAQIGQRRSKGCIRMKNEDIQKVHDLAFVGMEVKILSDNVKLQKPLESPTPSPIDSIANQSDNSIQETDGGSLDASEVVTPEKIEPQPMIEQPEKTDSIR